MVSGHGINWLTNMRRRAIRMSESRNLKMSSPMSSKGTLKEVYLNGFKIMKMPSQNSSYLDKRHGMMMIARNVVWFKMLRTLAWLTQYLKN